MSMHVCPAGFGSSSVHHKPREEYWSGGPHDGRILRAEQRYCGGVAPQWNAFWQSTKEQQGAVPYCIAETVRFSHTPIASLRSAFRTPAGLNMTLWISGIVWWDVCVMFLGTHHGQR